MSTTGDLAGRWKLRAGQAAHRVAERTERMLGGRLRTRVIIILACVLALSGADAATVGAAATELRQALHVDNTDIGLLVTASSLVGALASVPFGVLADRVPRTRTLGAAIVLWGVAMLWGASASSFGHLLLSRLFLGVVTAASGPTVASLVGDYFLGSERGRIYSWILTGELAGAGFGFAVTGDVAALSWRAALVILAIPAFVLAWHVWRLPEPARGTRRPLMPERGMPFAPADGNGAGGTAAPGTAGFDFTPGSGTAGPAAPGPGGSGPGGPGPGGPGPGGSGAAPTDAQRLAAERGIQPDPERILSGRLERLNILSAARAVLRIRTNVTLIVASACAYYFLSGVETFGSEFAKEQFRINQAFANLLLLVVGGGAVAGVLVAGRFTDRLLQKGFLNSRILATAGAAGLATVLFVPSLLTRSITTALPYLTVAAFMLGAQNPPIDAARLDIVPPRLWGRAEGIRTSLRSLAQSLAPFLFGAVADYVFGGGRQGLQWAFVVMLLPLAANAIILFRARRTYPRDVVTAAASSSSPVADAPGRLEDLPNSSLS